MEYSFSYLEFIFKEIKSCYKWVGAVTHHLMIRTNFKAVVLCSACDGW